MHHLFLLWAAVIRSQTSFFPVVMKFKPLSRNHVILTPYAHPIQRVLTYQILRPNRVIKMLDEYVHMCMCKCNTSCYQPHLLSTCNGVYITKTEPFLLELHNNTECNTIELCIKFSVALCALREWEQIPTKIWSGLFPLCSRTRYMHRLAELYSDEVLRLNIAVNYDHKSGHINFSIVQIELIMSHPYLALLRLNKLN